MTKPVKWIHFIDGTGETQARLVATQDMLTLLRLMEPHCMHEIRQTETTLFIYEPEEPSNEY